MIGTHDYAWADEATEATVAVVSNGPSSDEALLARLGRVEVKDAMSFGAALELQGTLYDDGTFEARAVVQVARVPGNGGPWWVTVEPNGFRTSISETLLALAGRERAVSFFWNVNAVMRVLRVDNGRLVSEFDPLIDIDHVPEEGRDLPFGKQPGSAAFALVERWTGVSIGEDWFLASKPT